jgi:hypothetical protein
LELLSNFGLILGASAKDFRPFVAKLIDAGLKYSIIVMDEDRVLGGGIGNAVTLNPKDAVEPQVRDDYGKSRLYLILTLIVMNLSN